MTLHSIQRGCIQKIYLVGLGAIGAKYASKLYDFNPALVTVIANQERRARLQEACIHVNGRPYPFPMIDPEEQAPAADLILVAVKNSHLPQAIADMTPFVGPNTVVLSLLNGILSEEVIGRAIGQQHMLYANVYMDAVREGNSVRYADLGKVVFGEEKNPVLSSRVVAIQHLFATAGIPYETPADMLHALWNKFMLNVGVNQASAILRAPFYVFQREGFARELMLSAAREVVAISEKHGVPLSEEDVSRFVAIIDRLDPAAKTSLLQDIEAGRATEVDSFAGAVLELGKLHDVPTPVNAIFYRIIRAMEEIATRSAGSFL